MTNLTSGKKETSKRDPVEILLRLDGLPPVPMEALYSNNFKDDYPLQEFISGISWLSEDEFIDLFCEEGKIYVRMPSNISEIIRACNKMIKSLVKRHLDKAIKEYVTENLQEIQEIINEKNDSENP